MAQNGRTSFILPDSAGSAASGSTGTGQYLDAARRRDRFIRREAARRTSESGAPRDPGAETFDLKPGDVEKAALAMCEQLKYGRLSRTQLEQEQREDADRLAGWRAVTPDPHTNGAELVKKIQYRMAVRNRALDMYDTYDLSNLTSRTRTGQVTPEQPKWKPWRPGAEPGAKRY